MSRTLVVSYPLLISLNVYIVRQQGHVTTFETGDAKPFSERPELHRYFTFPIDFQPRETVVLSQATTSSSMQIPMELWLPEKLPLPQRQRSIAGTGNLHYGIMLIMVIYKFLYFPGR